MALDAKRRLFVPYIPSLPMTMRDGGGSAGVRPSTRGAALSPETPASPDASTGARGDEQTATDPNATRRLSADVLLVDDDADVRWTVAEILRSAGYSVTEAEDGEVGLELLRTEQFRMVLLDIRMPRRDGVSLIEEARAVPPVIVHSAYSLNAEDRERLGSRVVDYLHKPVSPQKLLRAVETVLGPPR
jgi:two-component system chemotaxis response regulator CheY